MRIAGITLLASTLMLVGCGDPSTLSKEDAERFWKETGKDASGFAATDPNALTATESISRTQDCAFGGDISINGSATLTTFDGSLNTTANVSAAYNQCAASQDYTVDGNLTLTMNMNIGDDNSSADLSMNGILTMTGEIEGTCALNLTMHTTIDANNQVTVAYSGSICGHEAKAFVEIDNDAS